MNDVGFCTPMSSVLCARIKLVVESNGVNERHFWKLHRWHGGYDNFKESESAVEDNSIKF